MAHQEQSQTSRFDLTRGLYLADNYMRMADRAVRDVSALDKSEAAGDTSGPICLAISSFAFALEIYFKSIVFAGEERALRGHDLERLWNQLPDAARGWLSDNFDRNYESTGEDWSVLLLFDAFRLDPSARARDQTPGASARDVVYGHRQAFTVGRYGYELPPPSKLKPILFNIPGLQVLSWLTRALAYHFAEQRQILSQTKGGSVERHTVTFRLPGGPIPRFPNDLKRHR